MRSRIIVVGCALVLGCGEPSSSPADGAGTEGVSSGPTSSTDAPSSGPSPTAGDASGTGVEPESTSSTTETSGTDDESGSGDSTGDSTGNVDTGEPQPCQITACQGKVYQCGDCIDNDGDGLIDTADPDCWGPCDNNEAGWKGGIPGGNEPPCKMDCYFDANSGSGDDECYWSHACDPLEPSGSQCSYNPNANIPGTPMNCAQASAMQSDTCDDFCGPLVPNGCDCFGCCEVKVGNDVHVVFLGTEDGAGNGTCNLENVADPDLCAPCTPVPGCFNPCEDDMCEFCIGQVELPPGCEEAKCPAGLESCDPAQGNADCPDGLACITGCCTPVPQ